MNKQFIGWLSIALLIVLFVSGCSGERAETIVIPAQEENNIENHNSHPFLVKKIYPLPAVDKLFGWSSTNSIIGIFKKEEVAKRVPDYLHTLAFPYETPEMLQEWHQYTFNLLVSPDGKKMVEIMMSSTSNKGIINLISVQDGSKTEIATIDYNKLMYVQGGAWSNNSRYICYLVLAAKKKQPAEVHLFDTDTGSLKTYPLKEIENESPTAISISDNGDNLLLTILPNSKRDSSIIMGTITDNGINLQSEKLRTLGEPTWLNNNQFVFLGPENTLYEYDQRNGELSALLEKVTSFKFSPDRKKIAYFLYDRDTVYAGKLQGRNILFQEPVYHGIVPFDLFWSPDGNNLLIHGQKQSSPAEGSLTQIVPNNDSAYIVAF